MLSSISEFMGTVRFWMALSFILATSLLIVLAADNLSVGRNDAYEKRAWCYSLGGQYGGEKCFKDGVEMRMEK